MVLKQIFRYDVDFGDDEEVFEAKIHCLLWRPNRSKELPYEFFTAEIINNFFWFIFQSGLNAATAQPSSLPRD